jgi:PAS domain S-box-containing protein
MAEAGYQKVLAEGLVQDYPLTIRHVSGRTTDVLYNAAVYRNEAGHVQGVFAAARDVTELKGIEEKLRATSLYARSLLEASLDPLVTISPEGKITDVNRATELVTGVERERLIGSSFSEYFTEPPMAEAGYQKVLAEGLVQDYPLTIRHVSGRTTDVLYNAVVYRNEAGRVQGVFAAARDITERKQAEAELARYRDHLEELVRVRTAELARSNQELEQFAYVASHDLQEPLRAVTGYLGLFEQRSGEHLDDRSRQYVAGAVQGAARMHTLITDLLTLSRVGTHGQTFETTDLNAVLDHALDGLRASVNETGAKIASDPMPTLRVDSSQMVQLFQNLIGNALKFRGDRPPEVHLGAERRAGEWVLSVRDNGIGIEPQYFERIFLVFQRLHGRNQFPGTGIGLAICKKIVERHGGTIWIESQVGQGSTFYFTIPE